MCWRVKGNKTKHEDFKMSYVFYLLSLYLLFLNLLLSLLSSFPLVYICVWLCLQCITIGVKTIKRLFKAYKMIRLLERNIKTVDAFILFVVVYLSTNIYYRWYHHQVLQEFMLLYSFSGNYYHIKNQARLNKYTFKIKLVLLFIVQRI